MTSEASASMGWVNTVLACALSLGVSQVQLLAAADLPEEALTLERWPIDFITRLWRAAEKTTGDLGFGLKVGGEVSLASVNVVSFALQSASSLRDAISMVQKYQRLVSDGGRFQLLAGAHASWLVYHPRQGELAFSPHQIEAVLAAVVNLASRLTGQKMAAQRVQLSQARLGPLKGYRSAFACEVDFEQAFSGLLIDNALLDAPLPQSDAQVARLHEQHLAARLASLNDAKEPADDLRAWLAKRLGSGLPKRAEAAAWLGIGERTLARRLAAQELSFESLLDEVRREQALARVQAGKESLAEIAQALGFAEVSPFYRAFKRWTGLPPARWRKQR